MVSLSKPHRPQSSKFSPLEKAFAQALYNYYHASAQQQRNEAVNHLLAAFRVKEKTQRVLDSRSLFTN